MPAFLEFTVVYLCPFELYIRKNLIGKKMPLTMAYWKKSPHGYTCSECGSLHPQYLPWYLKKAECGLDVALYYELGEMAMIIEDSRLGSTVFTMPHAPSDGMIHRIKRAIKTSTRLRLLAANR